MIQVSKHELAILQQRFPELEISRSVRKYYIPERPAIIAFLRRLRNGPKRYETR